MKFSATNQPGNASQFRGSQQAAEPVEAPESSKGSKGSGKERQRAGFAKARAKQQLKAGKISKAQYDKIVAAANRVLLKSSLSGE